MKKIYSYLGLLTLMLIVSPLSAQVQVGSGTTNTTALPITSCWAFSYTQQIYLSSEVDASGSITEVSFYYESGGPATNSLDWTIYLGHSTKSNFSSTTDWEVIANLNQAFTGMIAYPATSGWMTITLDTPFLYNGTDNLVIAVEENQPGYNCSVNFKGFSAADRGIHYRSDTTNPDPTAPPTATAVLGTIPNVILGGITQACPTPSSLSVSNTTPTSTELEWTENGTATSWDIEWDTAGFTPTGTPTIAGVTSNPYSLSGLTPATSYDYYVRADCGTDGFSGWVGPFNFVTACAISTIPTVIEYFDDATSNFNTNLDMPCWSEGTGALTASTTITEANGGWGVQDYNNDGAHPNGSAAYINLYSSAGSTDWLISQSIDLDSAVEPELRFDASVVPWSGTDPVTTMGDHYVHVVVSTDDGATWSDLNIVQTYDSSNIPDGGISEEIDLSGYTGVVKIGFYANQDGTNPDLRFYIDNFEVVETFVCDMPTDVVVEEEGVDSAEFSWTASASEINGYEWIVFNSGDDPLVDPAVATGTVATGVTTVIVTGLDQDTTYDFYVRTDCDAGFSGWEGPMTFTTDQGASVNDLDINSIVFYPNPMADVVNITAQVEIEKVVFFSLTGQKLIEVVVGNTDSQIDVSTFATGTYLMQVTTATGNVGVYNLIKR